jgi:glycosyltransferase involved in cell wall biosynthesis
MNVKIKAKIKIAYVLPSLDKGGAERFLIDLILNLDKEIFDPVLVLFKRGGEWEQELAAQNIPVVIFHKKWKIDLLNFWQLLNFLKKFQPQIIHTQLGGDIYGRLAAKLLKTPVIITTEQNVNPDETWYYNLAKKITARWADKIVAISRAVKKDTLNRYQTPEDKIIIIPNGVKIETFISSDLNSATKNNSEESRPFLIGTIGRLSPQKGQTVLIEALTRLKTPNFRCLIASDGELRDKLTEQIKTSGLENKVELVGYVNATVFLNSLDIFVLPSLWEGLGIVLLEAGLCGRPVIASAVDGITDIIDKDTGWLVAPGDAQDLTEKIDWLLNNLGTPEVNLKVKNLRAKVIAEFDIKKVAADYQALYHDLLKAKLIIK